MNTAIVIPIYKSEIEESEYNSLVQCKSILSKYPIIFIHPEGLDLVTYKKELLNASFEVFPSNYFKDISGYNKLLLSPLFYRRFKFEFILIYQLDAWIFEDKLKEWCEKKFDYIGAPYTLEPSIAENCMDLKPGQFVINGGLSLRNTKACLRVSRIFHLFFRSYTGNEDAYFSGCFSRFFFVKYLIKLPNFKTALSFSMEKDPKSFYKLNNSNLPFGCHAFKKYDFNFWKKHGLNA